jgi:S1-C subfamily serine protease
MRLEDAAKGVVLVRISGGFGSGVLISPDGYILTNHHVTRNARRVHIRWADGSETTGEVMRTDAARDVSLIRAAKVSGTALGLRHRPVEVGEVVYAIGTPLDGELQNTVTRGVVSAKRMIHDQPFIQSDAQVTHGDSGGPLLDAGGAVVALTDMGLDPAKGGGGLNFFIPIDDALKVLAIEPMAGAAPPVKLRHATPAAHGKAPASP